MAYFMPRPALPFTVKSVSDPAARLTRPPRRILTRTTRKKKRSSTQKVKRRNWLAGCELPFPAGEANENGRISVEV